MAKRLFSLFFPYVFILPCGGVSMNEAIVSLPLFCARAAHAGYRCFWSPLLLLLPILLYGCAFTSTGRSPERDFAVLDAVVPAERAALSSDIAEPWTLDRLIGASITTNPRVLGSLAGYRAAESRADAAWAEYLPVPYVDMRYDARDGDRVGVFGIRQPLWSGGKLSSGLQAARSIAWSSKLSISEMQLSTALDVVNRYQAILCHRVRIEAHTKGVSLLERYASMMERRKASGISSSMEVSLVASRLLQERSDLSMARAGLHTELDHLSLLVGQRLSGKDLSFADDQGMVAPPALDTLHDHAMHRNPMLARASATIDVARHQRSKELANLLPTVVLKAEHQSDFSGTDVENAVYMTMEYEFGGGLAALGAIRSARSGIEKARQNEESVRRDLEAVLHEEHESCQVSLARYTLSRDKTRYSQAVLDSYTRLFVAGKVSWLDLLNSARELIQNEVATGDLLASYWGSLYRLRLYSADPELLGGLINDQASTPADSPVEDVDTDES